jgi:hypothetical protein
MNKLHHAFSKKNVILMKLEARRVFGNPIKSFTLKIERFEFLLKGLNWDLVVRVTEDNVFDLVVNYPTFVA